MRTYQTESATIVVERIDWRNTVVAVSTASCRRGVEFKFDRSGKRAAAWLAEQDLTGRVWAGQTWAQLQDAVRAPQPVTAAVEPAVAVAATSADIAAQVEALVTERVEQVLAEHYRQMLSSPEQRRTVSRMIREAAVMEKAERIRNASR